MWRKVCVMATRQLTAKGFWELWGWE
jgi:hypothetical protein